MSAKMNLRAPNQALNRVRNSNFQGGFRRRLIPVLGAAVSLLMPCFAGAQSSLPQARLSTSIDEGQFNQLRGNLHPLARAQNDQGAADPALKLERITLMFQPTAAQQADLDSLLAAQQNPTSPSFHQWLTPQQYGDRFGIAPADLAKVTAWLQAKGFAVVETPASRNFIVFNGTAGQVSAAFHTQIHNYEVKGQKFYANSSEPSLPAALAGVVAGFRGLNSVRLQPRAVPSKPVSANVQPNLTSSVSGSHFITPGDFATIYDLKPLYAASPAIDGTGQKIVIVGQSQIVLSDIATFRSLSGLSANVPQVILDPISANNPPPVLDGDVQESSLDIEWAGAVAKNATIIFVYSNNVLDALQYAVTQNYAPVISISYGSCEAVNPVSEIQALAAVAQQANAQGITIVSSVGDAGATDCDGNVSNYPAELGLNVDFPASMPYVTGVGGTEFNDGNGQYWQPANGSDVISSALSYIPEMVWNDTPVTNALNAGGGGASSIFAKPSWQTGTGVPGDGARDVPDIALNASDTHDSYLICSRLPGTSTPSCQNGFRNSTSDLNFDPYGGTSFGAPTFAGMVALINQKTGSSGQGNLNYILYPLAAISSPAFHDITTGNNDSPCVFSTQDCPSGNPIGFSAGLGYDQTTGLGTIDATNLVNSWSSISNGTGGSTPVLSSISPASVTAGVADFTLTASGSNFATNAQILWNGSAAGVTMQSGGTSTTIKATISHTLVAFGTSTAGTVGATVPLTTTFVSVTDDAAKAGQSASQPFTVNGTPPANDNIANATVIASSNYTNTVDNSAATTESTDPTPACALTGPGASTNPRTKTVWWTFTSNGTANVTVSTIGSSYDTTLSVWTGTPGSLANVACNDDVSSGQYTQSLLSFATTTGTKYYIMVAPFGPPDFPVDQAGGKTVLNVVGAPLASAPPVITSANSAAFTVGVSGTFTVTATGSPAPTFAESGSLPSGVTFNTQTGVLSGTPLAGTANTYPITFTASNGIGTPATQNFSFSVVAPVLSSTPTSQTVAAGSSATYTIANASSTATYALSCTGLPTGASCGAVSISPNSSGSLVIATTLRTAGVSPSSNGRHFDIHLWPNAWIVLAISLAAGLAMRKRKRFALVPLGALALLLFIATGCGSSGSSGPITNPNGTPPGTYTITVTGTASGVPAQTFNITLNVT